VERPFLAGVLPSPSLTLNVVLALLVMPTVVVVVELAMLAQSGLIGGRGRGVPVLDVLEQPADPMERDIRRIKGTFRRLRSREMVASGELPVPEMLSHDLADHLKLALQMQVGSRARGGEDLPDLLERRGRARAYHLHADRPRGGRQPPRGPRG
jgi:hypothetical protein